MDSDLDTGWLLLTNDDGIEAVGIQMLVEKLNSRGHKVIVFAPSTNHSATGMRINLMTPIAWRFREDLKQKWNVNSQNLHPVSYTHLTLPTIYSV